MSATRLLNLWVALSLWLLSTVTLAQDDINIPLVETFVFPAYQEMLVVNQALDSETQAYCSAPSKQGLKDLRDAFHAAMDSNQYAGVSRWPHTEGPWSYLNYYPDIRGVTPDQMARLLAASDSAALESQRFTKGSAALQGLGAFEVVLFGEEITPYACQVLLAISHSMTVKTETYLSKWTVGPLNFRVQIRNPSDGMMPFHRVDEVVADVITDLHNVLYMAAFVKLQLPMQRLDQGQVAREENWRSKRWLRNIDINLQAANKLYTLGLEPRVMELEAGQPLAASARQLFNQISNLIEELQNGPEQEFAELANSELLMELMSALFELDSLIVTEMSQVLTTGFGFNFSDGD